MDLTPRRLFTAILLIALVVMATREIADPDFWWHLRTGQFILETGTVPHGDIFSYTNAGRPWVTHEWLSEVLIYALYRLGSYPALILTFSAIVALSFALVFFRSKGQPYIAAFAVLLAALASAPTWGVRPQIISLLLTSVFLFVLEKHRGENKGDDVDDHMGEHKGDHIGDHKGDHKGRPYVWVLVPLMLLWVNLHSGFALGLALIAIYLFGEIADHIFTPTPPHSHTPNFPPSPILPHSHTPRTLALVLLACLLVVPLNPNGATMYIYPFETLGSRAMQAYIQEWFSPDFHQIEWQPFAWLVFGTLAAVALSGKRTSVTRVTLLAVFGYAGLRSARLIPIFALIAAPILAEHLWSILETRGWTAALQSRARVSRGMSFVNWLLLLVIVLAAALRVGMVIGNQTAAERAKFPAAAVDFLQARRGGVTPPLLYNAYGWGGYLIWRLYPEQRVFIDGRADVYGDAFMEEFLTAWRGGANWRAPLERFGVQVVLVESDAPIASRLAQDREWKQVYSDVQARIFQRQ
ncbi:MAG: hypothetical protein HY782_06225 [Chloroflexi bacterium]|nr:hypothetical protein [Chloroflexota bacterium]